MKTRWLNLILILAILLPGAGIIQAAPIARLQTPFYAATTVAITTTGFTPAQVTIQSGATVEWVNQTTDPQQIIGGAPYRIYLPLALRNHSNVTHIAYFNTVMSPQAPTWASDEIAPGGHFTYTFATPGNYTYYLASAPDITGLVIVQGHSQCIPLMDIDFTSNSPVDLGQAMTFAAVPTPANASSPFTYTWDFGGDGTQGGTTQNPTYSYATAGTYSVALTATNACSGPFTATNAVTVTALVPGIDLVVDSIQVSPSSPIATQPVTVSVTIRNRGDAGASGTFYMYLYIDPATPPAAGETGDYVWTKSSLAPGATETLIYNYGGFSTAGEHTLWAQVDAFGNISESDETNNIAGPVTVTVQTALADLVVESVTTDPLTPTLNQPCTLTVQIKNQGIANITDTFQVSAYVDPATPPSPGEDGTYTWQPAGLAMGASAILTREVVFTAGGAHTLYAQVDTGQAISESNEANNISAPYTLSVHVPMPDLIVQAIATDPTTPTIGYGFTLQVGIKNQGDQDAPETFRVDWYHNPGAPPISTTLGNGYWEQTGLRAGEVVTLTTLVTVTTPGDHTFYAQVDTASGGADAVVERDETNNVTGPVIVTADVPKPDLLVERITTDPELPRVNQAATLQVVIKNRGYLATGSAFRVDWYRDPAATPARGETGDGYWTVPSLAVGQITTLTTSIVLTQPLTYPFYAQVDTLNANQETDESNNIYGPDGVAAMDEATTSDLCTINNGNINQNLILTTAHSPYLILDCNVRMGDGNVLLVESGVIVKILDHSLYIGDSGQLLAQGTAVQPVVFTSYLDDTYGGDTNGDGEITAPSGGNWDYILGERVSYIDLRHTVVRYGGGYYSGVYSNLYIQGHLMLRDSVVELAHYNGNGVYINPESNTTPDILIEHSTIQNNGRNGIYVSGQDAQLGSLIIRENTIAGHTSADEWGIFLYQIDNFDILSNTLQNNGQAGDVTDSGGIKVSGGSTGVISGNLITRNDYAAVGIRVANARPQVVNNTVSGYALAVGVSGGYPQSVPTYSSNDFSDVQYQTIGVWGTIVEGTWTSFGGYNHVIAEEATIGSGTTFTVPAGTVVKFLNNFNVNLTLNTGATLRSRGTAAQPVVFTSIRDDTYGGDTNSDGQVTAPARGDWGYIEGGRVSHIDLQHTIVRYGGEYYNNDHVTFDVRGHLTLQDSVIELSEEDGIYIHPETDTTPDILIERSTIQNNGNDGIYVDGQDAQPGSLIIREDTIADHTAENSWGIFLYQIDSFDVLSNTLENNGYVWDVTNSGGIRVSGGSIGVISGNLVTRSDYAAVGIRVADARPQVVNNTVSGYALAVGISGGYPQSVPTYSGNNFSDVQYQTIGVWGTIVEGTWTSFGGYNHVIAEEATIGSGTTFTVPAGTVVKFLNNFNVNLTLNTGATLRSRGTAAQPVVFTSIRDDTYGGDTNSDGQVTAPARGDWGYIEGGRVSHIDLQHTIVRYGGEYYNNDHVTFDVRGHLTLQDSVIELSEEDGIYIHPETDTTPDILIERSTIQDNGNVGIYISGYYAQPGNFTCRDNNIAGNTSYGLYYAYGGGNRLDATNNWWGHDSGPTHPSNPGGMGDRVSDDVDFDPWIGKAAWQVERVVEPALPPEPIRNTEPSEPGVPYVVSITPNYDGMFLVGFPLVSFRFKIKVDWNGSDPGDGNPSRVEVRMNGLTTGLGASGTEATWHVDMDNLRVGISPQDNQFTIVAYNADGIASKPFVRSVPVVDIGPWFWVGDNSYSTDGRYLKYKSTLNIPPFDFGDYMEGSDEIPLLDQIGTKFKSLEISVEYSSKGTGALELSTPLAEPKIGDFKVKIEGEGSGEIDLIGDTVHLTELTLGVSGSASIKTPKMPLPAPVSFIMWQAAIEPKIGASWGIEECEDDSGALVSGLCWKDYVEIDTKFIGAGILSTGLEKIAYLEGKVGAGPVATLVLPEQSYGYVKKFGADFVLSAKGELLFMSKEWKVTWRCNKNYETGVIVCPEIIDESGRSLAAGFQPTLLEVSDWHITDRAWIEIPNYATFQGNTGYDIQSRRSTLLRFATASATDAVTMTSNVYPYAVPAMAVQDNQAVLVWVHDDPAKPISQSMELRYSLWDGNAWSAPAYLTTNDLLDVQPVIAYDGIGQPVAMWVQVDGAQSATTPRELMPHYELAYSVYNTATLTWSAPATLTHNAYMDALPKLALAPDGALNAVWLSANADDFPVAPDEHISTTSTIWTSVWNGVAWTTPTPVITNTHGEARPAFLAGTPAVIAWSEDTDGDSYTTADHEIMVSTNGGPSWSVPVVLTTNTHGDVLPALGRNSSGDPVLVWVREHVTSTVTATATKSVDQLYYTILSGGTWTAPVLAFEAEGMAELAMTTTPDGDLILLWQQVSEYGPDIYYAVFDQQTNLWGQSYQLTQDQAVEWAFSPGILASGQLMSPYLKRTVITETQVIDLGGGTTITVPMPVLQEANLMVLTHTLVTDLAVVPNSLHLSQANPAPGDTVTISATLQNQGDLALSNVSVKFYDGDPMAGGTLIASKTLSSLAAGYTVTTSIAWFVPTTPVTHTVYVVGDPDNVITESNEANNTASAITTVPDVAVINARTYYYDQHNVVPLAVVANNGPITATDVLVEFRMDTLTGTVAYSNTIAELGPTSLAAITTTWNVAGWVTGEHTYYAVVDGEDAIYEIDETDNAADFVVKVMPDLVIYSGDVQADLTESGGPVTVTVRNWGTADAADVQVVLYEGNALTTSATAIYTWTVVSLPVDSDGDIQLSTTLDYLPTQLLAIVDPTNVITEVEEHNNITSMQPLSSTLRYQSSANIELIVLSVKNTHPVQSTSTGVWAIPTLRESTQNWIARRTAHIREMWEC